MSSYYGYFDKLTDDGYVFNGDRSSAEAPQRKLTEEESKERREWKKTLKKLRNHYNSDKAGDPPEVKTTQDLMQIRLLPPRLEDKKNDITSRTADKEFRIRLYPKPAQVQAWDEFHEQVREYEPPDNALRQSNYGGLFLDALLDSESKSYNSEKGEERYLLNFFDSTLVRSKIIKKIDREDEAQGLHGRPDFTMWAKPPGKKNSKPKLAVVGESKSTHNLLLPSEKEDVVSKYGEAYKAVIEDRKERTREWCHIAHPFAQLLCYMVDNKHRYGALTCATRTYFLFLEGNGEDMEVKVSDPYFSGESTYLRAWSYVVSLGAAQKGKFVFPPGWVRTDSGNPTPDGKNTGTGGGSRRQPNTDRNQKKRGRSAQKGGTPSKRNKGASLDLKTVPFQDLKFGAVIGFGRNGSVFEVRWKDRKVALKQFDLGKGGYDAYRNELAAYTRLKDAWGRLTPEPLFVSESMSGGILYLGLELGRDPSGSDYESEEWSSVLDSLENVYGIRQHDSINCNGLIITREGRDRLVAIDFEEWSD